MKEISTDGYVFVYCIRFYKRGKDIIFSFKNVIFHSTDFSKKPVGTNFDE